MSWIWMAQLALDVGLIFTVMALWRPNPKKNAEEVEERIAGSLNLLESRAAQLEKEMQAHRKVIDEQLSSLLGVCEQARNLLDKSPWRVTSFTPSREERELKSLAQPDRHPEVVPTKIPTLQELEQVKRRHHSDITLDLKTLLKDQLA